MYLLSVCSYGFVVCFQIFDIVLDLYHLTFQHVCTFDKIVMLVDLFLNTEFEGGRHAVRIAEIAKIENGESL